MANPLVLALVQPDVLLVLCLVVLVPLAGPLVPELLQPKEWKV